MTPKYVLISLWSCFYMWSLKHLSNSLKLMIRITNVTDWIKRKHFQCELQYVTDRNISFIRLHNTMCHLNAVSVQRAHSSVCFQAGAWVHDWKWNPEDVWVTVCGLGFSSQCSPTQLFSFRHHEWNGARSIGAVRIGRSAEAGSS